MRLSRLQLILVVVTAVAVVAAVAIPTALAATGRLPRRGKGGEEGSLPNAARQQPLPPLLAVVGVDYHGDITDMWRTAFPEYMVLPRDHAAAMAVALLAAAAAAEKRLLVHIDASTPDSWQPLWEYVKRKPHTAAALHVLVVENNRVGGLRLGIARRLARELGVRTTPVTAADPRAYALVDPELRAAIVPLVKFFPNVPSPPLPPLPAAPPLCLAIVGSRIFGPSSPYPTEPLLRQLGQAALHAGLPPGALRVDIHGHNPADAVAAAAAALSPQLELRNLGPQPSWATGPYAGLLFHKEAGVVCGALLRAVAVGLPVLTTTDIIASTGGQPYMAPGVAAGVHHVLPSTGALCEFIVQEAASGGRRLAASRAVAERPPLLRNKGDVAAQALRALGERNDAGPAAAAWAALPTGSLPPASGSGGGPQGGGSAQTASPAAAPT